MVMIARRTTGGTSQETIGLRGQPFHVCQMYLLPDIFINGRLHQGQPTNTRGIRVVLVTAHVLANANATRFQPMVQNLTRTFLPSAVTIALFMWQLSDCNEDGRVRYVGELRYSSATRRTST